MVYNFDRFKIKGRGMIKKVLAFFIAASMFLHATAELYSGDKATVSNGYGITVHNSADPSSKTIATIPFLSQIDVIENSYVEITIDGISSTWIKIRYEHELPVITDEEIPMDFPLEIIDEDIDETEPADEEMEELQSEPEVVTSDEYIDDAPEMEIIIGYVFGGWLANSDDRIKPFLNETWSLSGGRVLYSFKDDGTFTFGINSTDYNGSGTWIVSSRSLILEGTATKNHFEESFKENYDFFFEEDGTINLGEKSFMPLRNIRYFIGEKEITDDLFYYSKVYAQPCRKNTELFMLKDGLFEGWYSDIDLTEACPFIPQGTRGNLVLYGKFIDPSQPQITFPGVMKTIKKEVFKNNSTLERIRLENGITEVEESAFENCENLESIAMGNSIKRIASFSFANTGIESVVIPEGCRSVLVGAFSDCRNLRSISFPSTMEEVDLACICSVRKKSKPISITIRSRNYLTLTCRTDLFEEATDKKYGIQEAQMPKIKAVYVPADCVEKFKRNQVVQKYKLKVLPIKE